MRLWSVHPSFLDPKGLVALWREALLAQAVLAGRTRGYRFHPQLVRFEAHPSPQKAIGYYLQQIHKEAKVRGFRFNAQLIDTFLARKPSQIAVTTGQFDFEMHHLRRKIAARVSRAAGRAVVHAATRTHPLFRIVPGPVAAWERGA